MRIVFVTYRYWPAIGGVERYVGGLAAALVEMGHEVRVVTGAHTNGLPVAEAHNGVQIHRFPALRSPTRCRLHLLRLRPHLAAADVIHVSDVFMLEYLQRMFSRLLPRRPLFLTQHGLSFQFPIPDAEISRAQRAADCVDGLAHDGHFIGKWLQLAPDCVPPQGLSPAAGELAIVPEPASNSAVFIGRIEPDSGIATYLSALRLLREVHALPLRLDVYGDGTLRTNLAAQADGDGLDVHWHGARPEAAERLCDGCFAFVSGRMAIHEAMARRRVVIAAYDTALKKDYICGDAFSPHLVACGGAQALAGAVAALVRDGASRQKIVDGAYCYAATLDWRRTAEAYLELWAAAPRRSQRDVQACPMLLPAG